jgi:hypothetical protein
LLTGSDVLRIASDVSRGNGLDVQSVIDKANPLDKQPVQDLADKISSKIDLGKVLDQNNPSQEMTSSIPSSLGSNLPLGSLQ